ncbi:MAG: hypothetical protein AAGA29_11510 [Planctomycetota bacterium]
MSQQPPQPPQPQAYPPQQHYPPPPSGGMSGAVIALIVTGVVALVVIMLLIAILLPALGAARRTAKRMQNSTQLRGIHQGMVTYANSNRDHFPGLDAMGNILPNGIDTGNSGDGDTVEARYWILLNNGFITPEYAISPSEVAPMIEWGAGPVQSMNYSYALLSIDGSPGASPGTGDPLVPHRWNEWAQSLNTQAVVGGDRNTGTNATSGVQSIHTSQPGEWKGSVLWNDNHVSFESTPVVATRYDSGAMNNQDNLFEAAGDTDAYLIHQGD